MYKPVFSILCQKAKKCSKVNESETNGHRLPVSKFQTIWTWKTKILIDFKDWINKSLCIHCANQVRVYNFICFHFRWLYNKVFLWKWVQFSGPMALSRMIIIPLSNTEVTFQICTMLWNNRHMHILLLQLCLQFVIQCQQKILNKSLELCKCVFFILALCVLSNKTVT